MIRNKNAGRGDCIAEARRRSVRHGDNLDWLGGHSANQEAQRSVCGALG